MHQISNDELVIHVLNVGRADTIIIELPADSNGMRSYGVVDCYDCDKLVSYLDRLRERRTGHQGLEFLCATHPHGDHILGIPKLLSLPRFRPAEFWDSGFRHSSQTYIRILQALHQNDIQLVRVSSGMERYFDRVRITALAPSVMLRNTYGTFGVDVNNASVVLRIELHRESCVLSESIRYKSGEGPEALRKASSSTVILSGDAEFDSWAHINEEFPMRKATDEHDPLVKKMLNMLNCSVLKVAHHGSMHSIPLEVLERMNPSLAIISTEQKEGTTDAGKTTQYTRNLFPHPSTVSALRETCQQVLCTDGSFDWPVNVDSTVSGGPGSVIIAVSPTGRPRYRKLTDARKQEAPIVNKI
jgi:beta-lactamase superfamily II metal-dependent hydrolase